MSLMRGSGRIHPGKRLLLQSFLAVMAIFAYSPDFSHSPLEGSVGERVAGLFNVVLLLGFWFLYWRGSRRVRTRPIYTVGFHLVFVICTLTVLGPLDAMAKTSTAAHMTQHMLLIAVIAPLWVLCRPLPQLMAGGLKHVKVLLLPVLQLVQWPMATASLHALAIWIWHLPYFYMLAVNSPGWHIFEHLCFLLTAGLFWWSVLRPATRNLPSAFLALMLTMVHTGFLGAILTFTQTPLYGESRNLADQQLAGLIMWVPGGIPYLSTMIWLAARWYRRIGV